MLVIKTIVHNWTEILYYLDRVEEEYIEYNINYTSDIYYNILRKNYSIIIKICN